MGVPDRIVVVDDQLGHAGTLTIDRVHRAKLVEVSHMYMLPDLDQHEQVLSNNSCFFIDLDIPERNTRNFSLQGGGKILSAIAGLQLIEEWMRVPQAKYSNTPTAILTGRDVSKVFEKIAAFKKLFPDIPIIKKIATGDSPLIKHYKLTRVENFIQYSYTYPIMKRGMITVDQLKIDLTSKEISSIRELVGDQKRVITRKEVSNFVKDMVVRILNESYRSIGITYSGNSGKLSKVIADIDTKNGNIIPSELFQASISKTLFSEDLKLTSDDKKMREFFESKALSTLQSCGGLGTSRWNVEYLDKTILMNVIV